MATCLVTGGAGFIGGMTARVLLDHGHRVVVLDDFSRGHRGALDPRGTLEEGDIRDRRRVRELLDAYRPDCVLHFAALAYVGESFDAPMRYFDVNIGGSVVLLEAMVEAGVPACVFSSSCTVYGEPDTLPLTEDAPLKPPVSPYGQSKLTVEQLLGWMGRTGPLRSLCLRYFNAAGAVRDHGEDHAPETHLIPLAIDAALGRRPPLRVFGDDYPTRDGTCVRDYVHVADLADAHRLAMDRLLAGAALPPAINLGSETGSTVREVLRAVEDVTGLAVPHVLGPRRDGDAPALVAGAALAREVLGWAPTRSSLHEIVLSAYSWRREHPDGYGD
ncbi:MAG: UDP-glucose 4-epimerase GalE [Deltaproteobacteria bacterium]|nr:UDP-glucose 4-epimerase GalE [Deltaproteobacteria bacterium]